MDKEYYLVTSSDNRCWKSDVPVIFFDEECICYNKNNISSIDQYIINKTRFESKTEFKKAQNYVDDLCNRLLEDFRHEFNRIHGVKYDLKSWRILLWEWLYAYVSSMYYKYVTLKDLTGKFHFYVSKIEVQDEVIIYNTSDFMDKTINDDFFNAYQTYRMALSLGIPVKGSIIGTLNNCREDWVKEEKKTLSGYWRSIIGFVSNINKKIVYNNDIDIKDRQMIKAVCSCGICFKYRQPFVLREVEIDRSIRKSLVFEGWQKENRFESILKEMLAFDIPLVYIEGFHSTLRKAIQYFGRNKRFFYAHNAWNSDEIAKAYIAYARHYYDLKLCGIQHGGTAVFIGDIFSSDTKATDYYYTWGCTRQVEGCVVSPMPSPKLGESLRNMRGIEQAKRDVLYVGTIPFRYLHRFYYPHEINTIGYIENQVRLISLLNISVHDFRCRLYINDAGWNIRDRVLEKCQSVTIDEDGVSFLKSISSAKLCVFDVFITTWTEVYIMNIPFIIITPEWMEDYYEDVLGDIELLKKVGIYYNDMNEAVDVIRTIQDDIVKWWNEPSRKEAIDKFARSYCMTSSDSRELWLSKVKSTN